MLLRDQRISSLDAHEAKRLYRDHVFLPWFKQEAVEPLYIREADGVYITLEDGQRLLDMKAQAFTANLGHNHAGMKKAIVEAAAKVSVYSSEVYSEERLALAMDLRRLMPKDDRRELCKVFYSLGGAEANENAIKIARMYTKRHKVITRYRSYHGATLAMINFSGDYRRIAVDDAVTGVVRFPDPYPRGSGQEIDTVRLLEEIIETEGPETIAAIMLEGITGANGVFVPPSDYWPRIRALCDRFGIVLIADEVLSGFLRTGRWFGVDHFKVVPDILTMSKGLTAGYSALGATMVSKEIADFFNHETLWCGLTQYGPSLSCAIARAALHHYEHDGIEENVQARAQELDHQLKALAQRCDLIAEVRNIGLLAAIDLRKSADNDAPLVPYRAKADELKPAQTLSRLLQKNGVSTIVRFGTILLSPPLIINADELQQGIDGIGRALRELKDSLEGKK